MSRTGLLLKKQLWIWPIIAVVLLATIGFVVSNSIRQTMENSLRSELQTLLDVERAMLLKWFRVQESSAQTLANDPQVRQAVIQLVEADSETAPDTAVDKTKSTDEMRARLSKELEPGMDASDFIGYVLVDKQQKVIAAHSKGLIGQTIPQYETFLTRALDGQSTVCPPFPSVVLQKDKNGQLRSGVPTMFVSAPVRDQNLQVVAALAMRIRPEKEFTDILQLGRIGQSGETYAIDKTGLMVSNSRFDEELILLGLIPDREDSHSILNVLVRNPGGNMVEGFRPQVRRAELPLTEAAASAVSGASDINMTGYRGYRGAPKVGAWSWLPDYHMGLITEIDIAEAYHPLTILNRAFYTLYALLGIGAIAIFVFTLIVARMQREARKAAVEARHLGQYRLEEKIGAGAMGVVYKGHHAMLRRPTAIKMLDVERVNESSIQRFEREVQITCKLNNPHTVAIYDYGRTPEGVFYYAMEYLDGIDLQVLVDRYGPQPEGRVISILRQVCGSLYEAHSQGLVHRDVKPANIMLNRRGAEPDVIKVLDFGLVRALDDKKKAGDMSGTPLYMSPEAIQTPDLVDARSDLYAVGAVGYFLLTGQPVFNANSLAELCQQHLSVLPETPSQRLGRSLSPELEHAILACLEKSCAKRPQTARDLSAMLERIGNVHPWTLDEAEAWWSRHERSQQSSGFSLSGVSSSADKFAHTAATSSPNIAQPPGTITPALDQTSFFQPPSE